MLLKLSDFLKLIKQSAKGLFETDKTVSKGELRKKWTDEGLRKWKDKVMHGQFLSDMPETTDAEQTCSWLMSSDVKVQTDALSFTAQQQALKGL